MRNLVSLLATVFREDPGITSLIVICMFWWPNRPRILGNNKGSELQFGPVGGSLWDK